MNRQTIKKYQGIKIKQNQKKVIKMRKDKKKDKKKNVGEGEEKDKGRK